MPLVCKMPLWKKSIGQALAFLHLDLGLASPRDKFLLVMNYKVLGGGGIIEGLSAMLQVLGLITSTTK